MILIFSMLQYDHFNADEMILENSQKKYPSCKTIPYFLLFRITKKKHTKPLATPYMDTHPRPVCPLNPMRSVVPVKMLKELVDPDMQKELLHLSHGWSLKPHGNMPQLERCHALGVFEKSRTFFQNKQPNAKKIPRISLVWKGTPNFQNWVFGQGACPCREFANCHLHSKLVLELLCKGRSTCLHLLPLKMNDESVITIWWTHRTYT